MSRRFISLILAAALGVTTVAARPAAAAGSEDFARILGTLATIYIIGSAIEDARDDDGRKSYRHVYRDDDRRYRDDDRRYRYGRYGRDYDRRFRDDGRYGRWNRGPAPLPAGCLFRNGGRNRGEAVFGARCLEHRYDQADRLPQNCRIKVRTDHGKRQVYRAGCLAHYGFVTARR